MTSRRSWHGRPCSLSEHVFSPFIVEKKKRKKKREPADTIASRNTAENNSFRNARTRLRRRKRNKYVCSPRWTRRCSETYRVCEANAYAYHGRHRKWNASHCADESGRLTPVLDINDRVVRCSDEESRTEWTRRIFDCTD